MTAIKDLTAEQIHTRLSEMEAEAERHDARDMDAELHAALMDGADVDALERDHLEAERVARRARVEMAALRNALPTAKAREGAQEIDQLRKENERLAAEAQVARDELVTAAQNMDDAATRWESLRGKGLEIGTRARQIANATGADHGASFGVFTSAGAVDAILTIARLARTTHGEAGSGHPSTRLD